MSVPCKKCGHEHKDWVPLDRLNSQGATWEAKLNAAEEKIESLESQLASAPDVAKVQRRLERAQTQLEKIEGEYALARSEWETSSVLLSAGLTDADDQDLVRYRYGKLPEAGRPTLQDYVSGAAKEDRHLKHLFPAEQTETEQPQHRGLPNANGGVVSSKAGGGKYDPTIVAQMPYDKSRLEAHQSIMDAFRKG